MKYAIVISVECDDLYHAMDLRDQIERYANNLECQHIKHVVLHRDTRTEGQEPYAPWEQVAP